MVYSSSRRWEIGNRCFTYRKVGIFCWFSAIQWKKSPEKRKEEKKEGNRVDSYLSCIFLFVDGVLRSSLINFSPVNMELGSCELSGEPSSGHIIKLGGKTYFKSVAVVFNSEGTLYLFVIIGEIKCTQGFVLSCSLYIDWGLFLSAFTNAWPVLGAWKQNRLKNYLSHVPAPPLVRISAEV